MFLNMTNRMKGLIKTASAAMLAFVLVMQSGSYVMAADLQNGGQTLSPEELAWKAAAEADEALKQQQALKDAETAAAIAAAQAEAIANSNPDVQAAMLASQGFPGGAVISDASVGKLPDSAIGIKTVDLIIFAGQSNMSGAGGNAKQAPAVANGSAYEFRAVSDPTGLYPITEPFGVRESGYAGESPVVKQGSLVSAFVNTYYQRTGVPVVAVSASRGGTDSAYWAGANVRNDLFARYSKALNYLRANHYVVRHRYLVWLQGESDGAEGTTSTQYKTNLNTAFASLFAAGLEQVFFITPGIVQGGMFDYSGIIATQENMAATSNRYTVASEVLRTIPYSMLADEVHYNQQALNLAGQDAAAKIALYAR